MTLPKSRKIHPDRRHAYSWFWQRMKEAHLSLRQLAAIAEEMGEHFAPGTATHWFRSEQGQFPTNPEPQTILLIARIFQSRGLEVTTEDIRWHFGLSDTPPLSKEEWRVIEALRQIEQKDPQLAQRLRKETASWSEIAKRLQECQDRLNTTNAALSSA